MIAARLVECAHNSAPTQHTLPNQHFSRSKIENDIAIEDEHTTHASALTEPSRW